MTVTLNLDSEAVRRLREKAARNGQTLEAYLEQLAGEAAGREGTTTDHAAEEWIAAFRAWAASHRTLSHIADDSRESIYEGRGE